jgi:hypothetical protein
LQGLGLRVWGARVLADQLHAHLGVWVRGLAQGSRFGVRDWIAGFGAQDVGSQISSTHTCFDEEGSYLRLIDVLYHSQL